MDKNVLRASQISLGPVLLLLLWDAVTRYGGIHPVFLPSPMAVATAFWQLLSSGELVTHLIASLGRVLAGYIVAAVAGIGIGMILGWAVTFSRFVDPLVELFRPVSPISIIPLAILWFGIGEISKIILIAYSCFFPVLIGTIAGVRSAEPVLIRAASSLGASQLRILRTVLFPAAIPFIYTSLRVSMGIAMIVIISSEMVASDSGIGWFILDSERIYKTDYMFVGIISISLMSLAMDFGLKRARNVLAPWWKERSGPGNS